MKSLFYSTLLLCSGVVSAQILSDEVLKLHSGTQVEINNISSPDIGSVVYSTDDSKIYVYNGSTWSEAATDQQNITGSGLSGTTLTIGITNGNNDTVDLATLIDDADANVTNEIQILTSVDGSVTLTQNSNDYDLSVPLETVTSVANTIVGNKIADYTNESGTITTINETVSTLVDNGNGSYTYTDENGTVTSFSPSTSTASAITVDQSFLAKASVTGDSNQPNLILTLTSQRTDTGWSISGNQAIFNDSADYVLINAMTYMQQNVSNAFARINPELELLKNSIVVAKSSTGYQRHNSGHDSSSNTITYVDHNPSSGDIYQLRAQQGASQNDVLNIDLGHFDLIAVKKVSVVQTITQ